MGEEIKFATRSILPTAGSAGLRTQVSGEGATVSNFAAATGGISSGHFVGSDVK
jgi:hypothetical protein